MAREEQAWSARLLSKSQCVKSVDDCAIELGKKGGKRSEGILKALAKYFQPDVNNRYDIVLPDM